jgi:uncharacterized membrane protein YfcA
VSSGDLIVVAIAIFAAAFVYVLAGFGFALLAMPLMTLAIPVEQAVVISSMLAVASTMWQAVTIRHHADRRLVVRLTASSYLGMPLGLVILNVVDDRALRLVLGIGVLIATALLVRQINLAHVGAPLDYSMGFLSGVLNTSLGTNGPPLVFVLQARQLDPQRFRGTISLVFAFGNVLGITLFALDGKITADGVEAAVIALPAWLLGLGLGSRVRPHVHGERFRWLVLCLLFAAGATAVVFAIV